MYAKNTLSAINILVVLTLELRIHIKVVPEDIVLVNRTTSYIATAHVKAPEPGSNQIFIKVKFLKCVLIRKCACMCACTRLFKVYVMLM